MNVNDYSGHALDTKQKVFFRNINDGNSMWGRQTKKEERKQCKVRSVDILVNIE